MFLEHASVGSSMHAHICQTVIVCDLPMFAGAWPCHAAVRPFVAAPMEQRDSLKHERVKDCSMLTYAAEKNKEVEELL